MWHFSKKEEKERTVVDWCKCNSEQMWNDISYAVAELHMKFMGRFDPKSDPFTISISPDQYVYLAKKDAMGAELRHYFHVNWAHCLVVSGSPFDEKCFSASRASASSASDGGRTRHYAPCKCKATMV